MQILYRAARDFRQAFRQRLSEWAFALVMLMYGIVLVWPGASFDHAGYGIIKVLISENLLGWALFAGGFIRCVVLASNGVVWQMYGLRAFMAWSSMIVWMLLAVGFAESGTIGIPLAVFPVLCVFDCFNARKATEDTADRRRQTTQPSLVIAASRASRPAA
jgi:hypothetical protein